MVDGWRSVPFSDSGRVISVADRVVRVGYLVSWCLLVGLPGSDEGTVGYGNGKEHGYNVENVNEI